MVRFGMLAMAMVLAGSMSLAEEAPKPRFGVAVRDSSNNAGVYVASVDEDSPASRLRRVTDGVPVILHPKRYAITGFNGWPIHNSQEYVQNMAYAPKLCVFEVYDYETKATDYLQTELNGESIALPTPPVASAGDQWTYYQTEGSESRQPRERQKGGGLFGWKKLPQGDDWQPGDHVWLFQKKPTDPDLRKEYNRQMTREVFIGVATGAVQVGSSVSQRLSASPTYNYSHGPNHTGHSHPSRLQQKWNNEREVFNRTFSKNPLFRGPTEEFNPLID